nr:hypothetical protein Iba_chr07fCG8330 [Ipomoea batatas]
MLKFKSSIDTKDHRYSENGEGGRKLAEEGGRKQRGGRRLVGSGVWQSTIRGNNQTSGGAQPVIFRREEAANKETTDGVGLGSSAAGLGASASSSVSQLEAPTFSVQVGCFSLLAGPAIGASSPVFAIYRDEIGGGRS